MKGFVTFFKYSALIFEVHVLVTVLGMALYNLVDTYQEKGVRKFLPDVKHLREGKLSDDR
jgi:hypothetical protein